MLPRTRRGRRGFTLIELLVVVLILAILMAIALPLYLSAVADSQRKTCRANLQTIANAVQAKYVAGNGLTTYAAIAAAGVNPGNLPDLQAAPVCPTAGAYTIVVPGAKAGATYGVKCANHGEFDPGVDSN